jgi:hypothetical protein
MREKAGVHANVAEAPPLDELRARPDVELRLPQSPTEAGVRRPGETDSQPARARALQRAPGRWRAASRR